MSKIDLETLIAEKEIRQVMTRYCRSMDRIDAELGYGVWHEGGLADYGPVFNGTGRGFVDWVCEYHRTLDAQTHQLANILIDVQGDRAVSESGVNAGLLFRNSRVGGGAVIDVVQPPDGRQFLLNGRGRYLDEWSRRDGRWAIDKRVFLAEFTVVTEVQGIAGWSARDKSDLSYALLGPVGSA